MTSSDTEMSSYKNPNGENMLTHSAHDRKCLHKARAIGGYATTKTDLAFDTLLQWNARPSNISIIKKKHDPQCTTDLINACECLFSLQQNMNIYVEKDTFEQLQSNEHKREITSKLTEIPDMAHFGQGIDLIIVIGGDGTLLYLISLFTGRQTVPPIACFQRGSFGFLAPFDIGKFELTIRALLDPHEPQSICIRMRLTARLWKHPRNFSSKERLSRNKSTSSAYSMPMNERMNETPMPANTANTETENYEIKMNDKKTFAKNSSQILDEHRRSIERADMQALNFKNNNNKPYFSLSPIETSPKIFEIIDDSDVAFKKTTIMFPKHRFFGTISNALNEVLVHAESGPSLMLADLYVDGKYCTTVQADGMIFSTPTGSTAYNISAGGSLISPTVPCIAITPICPHTLSFRPVIVPDSTIIHLVLCQNARGKADLSYDGRNSVKVEKGDVVEIIRCPYPVPTFKSDKFNAEWFGGLVKKFNWNVREKQKSWEENYYSRPPTPLANVNR